MIRASSRPKAIRSSRRCVHVGSMSSTCSRKTKGTAFVTRRTSSSSMRQWKRFLPNISQESRGSERCANGLPGGRRKEEIASHQCRPREVRHELSFCPREAHLRYLEENIRYGSDREKEPRMAQVASSGADLRLFTHHRLIRGCIHE